MSTTNITMSKRAHAVGQVYEPPIIAHLVYRLDVGGLEAGLVNLINGIPPSRYRHAIICMAGYTDFAKRIKNPSVELHTLGKREGQDWVVYWRLWRLLRELKPDIVHSRNLATLEGQVAALLAGVSVRIHGEHGRDISDVLGTNWKHLLLRRVLRPLVTQYVALSKDLKSWLQERVHVPASNIMQIYNGVDGDRFHSSGSSREILPVANFVCEGSLVIGTVGQMRREKDQITLTKAFIELLKRDGSLADRIRLVMIGDGPLRLEAAQLLKAAGIEHLTWLPGIREDTERIMRGLDIFVLPSLIEGVSNTILEAMATGLPVVATDVGGNPELVIHGNTGMLVPPSDPVAMADALSTYLHDPMLMHRHGQAGRKRVERKFSMDRMVARYMAMYDGYLTSRCRSSLIHGVRKG